MAQVVANGSTVTVSSLTDAQIDAAVAAAIENDNHAAQNVDPTDSARTWFEQYCDLYARMFGRLATA